MKTPTRAEIAYLDAQIDQGYRTTQYLLIPAGDRPNMRDLNVDMVFSTVAAAEAVQVAQIDPEDWQIIEVTTMPVAGIRDVLVNGHTLDCAVNSTEGGACDDERCPVRNEVLA